MITIRVPTSMTLLAMLLCTLFFLPLGEQSLSHAGSAKNTKELNQLIENIQTNLAALQEVTDGLQTELESDKQNNIAQAEMSIQLNQQAIEKLQLIEESVNTVNAAIAELKQNDSLQKNSTQDFTNKLTTVDQSLKEIFALIDTKQLSITNNAKSITTLEQELDKTNRNVRTNSTDSSAQKSLIEDNSTRIYEVLIELVKTQQKMEKLNALISKNIADAKEQKKEPLDLTREVNKLWEIVNIILIFFIPLAFAHAYTGNDRLKDGVTVSDGLILTLFGAFFGYLTIGFGLMYGTSLGGVLGISSPFFELILTDAELDIQAKASEFMLYQAGTMILACLIIYSAVGIQLSSVNHSLLAVIMGAVFIPVFGHWTFADRFIEDNVGWMQAFGYYDGVGITAINMVSAFTAMGILYALRNAEPPAFTSSDVSVYSSSTIILLFIGWIGLTTGHLSINDPSIIIIVLNVVVAAISSSIVSLVQRLIFSSEKNRVTYALGGFVSGLVAIAACGEKVTLIEAIAVGAIAGSIHNVGFAFLRNSLFKKPWQNRGIHLVTIHGFSSVWGVMCVALLGTEGNFNSPNLITLGTQLEGVGIALVYSILVGMLVSMIVARSKPPEEPTGTAATTPKGKN